MAKLFFAELPWKSPQPIWWIITAGEGAKAGKVAFRNHLGFGRKADEKANFAALNRLNNAELWLAVFKHANKIAGVESLGCQESALGIHEGKQCHDACTLHSIGEIALLFCGEAGETAGKNLAAFSDELLEQIHILVIDGIARLDGGKALFEERAGH